MPSTTRITTQMLAVLLLLAGAHATNLSTNEQLDLAHAENARLRQEIESLRSENKGLRAQLDRETNAESVDLQETAEKSGKEAQKILEAKKLREQQKVKCVPTNLDDGTPAVHANCSLSTKLFKRIENTISPSELRAHLSWDIKINKDANGTYQDKASVSCPCNAGAEEISNQGLSAKFLKPKEALQLILGQIAALGVPPESATKESKAEFVMKMGYVAAKMFNCWTKTCTKDKVHKKKTAFLLKGGLFKRTVPPISDDFLKETRRTSFGFKRPSFGYKRRHGDLSNALSLDVEADEAWGGGHMC